MQGLSQLTPEQTELAFQILSDAWDKFRDDPKLAEADALPVEIPKELGHLGPADWDALGWLLNSLLRQKENSPVH